VSQTKPIVRQQEPVIAQSIRIKQLVSFAIARSMARVHSKVDAKKIWLPPALKSLELLGYFRQSLYSGLNLLPHFQFTHSAIKISFCELFIFFDQFVDDVSHSWLSLLSLVFVLCIGVVILVTTLIFVIVFIVRTRQVIQVPKIHMVILLQFLQCLVAVISFFSQLDHFDVVQRSVVTYFEILNIWL